MSDNEQLFSRLFARVRLAFTSLGAKNVVKANLTGLGLGKLPGQTEKVFATPLHGTPGVLSRPKGADADGTTATGFGVRFGDQIVPLVLVDPRVSEAFGQMPDPGVALAGYLGERILIDSTPPGKIVVQHGVLKIELDASPAAVPPGPKITISQTGGIPSSITMGPDGIVAIAGTSVTVNGVPLVVP